MLLLIAPPAQISFLNGPVDCFLSSLALANGQLELLCLRLVDMNGHLQVGWMVDGGFPIHADYLEWSFHAASEG